MAAGRNPARRRRSTQRSSRTDRRPGTQRIAIFCGGGVLPPITALNLSEDGDTLSSGSAGRIEIVSAVEKTVATLGRLDVLVNNAGTAIPKTFEETTLVEMDHVIDIDVRGILATTQAALKHMKSGGRIIMIGSAVGERVQVPGLVA
jgi:NAD(P)-dependent dehydrogenase (short-subunit alcohol dehydrogenase family)